MHICLRTDDIYPDIGRLRAEEITIDIEVWMGLDNNLGAWIIDADGNTIEMMQLSEESPRREAARTEAARGNRN